MYIKRKNTVIGYQDEQYAGAKIVYERRLKQLSLSQRQTDVSVDVFTIKPICNNTKCTEKII